jgi:anthranilate synthase component 2/putative glutamine amidotransferase
VRPLIGISTYREQARWGSWDIPAIVLPANYVDAIEAAGGQPVLLPTGVGSAAVVERLDGLVLAGGADVDPARYGEESGRHTTVLRPDRDGTEVGLLGAALDRALPVLAICRGLQLLNVVLGGDLVQHLPDEPGTAVHDPGPGLFAQHTVRTLAGTTTAALLGATTEAHCHHHQAVRRLATGLTATAWAEDGTIEAVEHAGGGFCLGVQWHPEAGEERALFAALVAAARATMPV